MLFMALSWLCQAKQEKPFITNFPKKKYGGDNKNWSIGQDEKGIMYFGNDVGLLEFDGINWILHSLPNRLTVRSLSVLSYDLIFTGSYQEFGRWDRDISGGLIYTSLSSGLDKSEFKNDDFWKIWSNDEFVYFQSFHSIYLYDYEKIERVPMDHGVLFLTQVRDEFWVQEMQGDLYRLRGKELEKVPGSEIFRNSDVRIILPYQTDELLIGTATHGIYVYDGSRFYPWNENLSALLSAVDLNCGLYTSHQTYMFGTILDGLYEVDTTGHLVNHISTEHRLQNNTVLSVFEENTGNIWAGLDRGISYIQYLPKMTYYVDPQGNTGSSYDAIFWNNRLFVATNQGVLCMDQKDLEQGSSSLSALKLVEGTQGQVWSFYLHNGRLFCCHNRGVKEILPDMRVVSPYTLGTGAYRMTETTLNNKKAILISAYTSLKLLDPESDRIYDLHQVSEPVINAQTDHLENVWLEHFNKGVYRCRLSEDLSRIESMRYFGGDSNDGLPYKLKLFKVRERVVLLGDSKFYIYDDITDSIVPNERLNECFREINDIRNVVHIEGSQYWALTGSTIYKFSYDGYNTNILEAHDLSAANLSLINAYENISILNDSVNLVCLDNGFLRYDNKTHSRNLYNTLDPPFLKAFYGSDNQGEIHYGDLSAPCKIPYHSNSITVAFSAKNTFASNYSFQYKLEGLNEKWSPAQKVNTVYYPRLPKGKYNLMIRTVDNLGSFSDPLRYEFEILPPWYRTLWGYLLLLLLLVGTLVLVWKMILRRYRNIHLMKIRNRETRRLRLVNEELQQKVEEKNAELLTQTFFVVQRNELLMKIKNELEEFYIRQNNRSLTPLFNKINSLLNANMDTENDWKSFLISFEQKHEGLFKRLKDSYPQLTSNDLRLCACLRLNLDSKDIASLMNVSVRAIENSRSRLRKKLNIPSSESLNDFLMQF